MATTDSTTPRHNPRDSTHPVLLPEFPELFYDTPSFKSYLASLPLPSTPAEDPVARSANKLAAFGLADTNRTFTANDDPTHVSSLDAVLDLFSHTKTADNVHDDHIEYELDNAWAESPLDTLKVIWNARSIHTGKGDRVLWYRCMGWLSKHHPRTFLENLDWVVRPVIKKKMAKKVEGGEEVGGEMEVITAEEPKGEEEEEGVTRFDVKYGVSHGYWRDLPNLLVLAVKGKLAVDMKKADLMAEPQPKVYASRPRKPAKKAKADMTKDELEAYEKSHKEQMDKHAADIARQRQESRARRHVKEAQSHGQILEKLGTDSFYKALHLSVARIFADQLDRDRKLLAAGRKNPAVSLAGKWAPSLEKTADRTTLLATTIAELLFPAGTFPLPADTPREEYLKHARQRYRQLLASLRNALDIVETPITAKEYAKINYSHVPSFAMTRYSTLFISKDLPRFESYIDAVGAGTRRISGAILTPPQMVHDVLEIGDKRHRFSAEPSVKKHAAKLELKMLDNQWRTLVQRIRDSGTLSSALAVVDVSGSMTSLYIDGKLTPMHASLGMGLLVAHVAKPPFANKFITFSESPKLQSVSSCDTWGDSKRSMYEELSQMNKTEWGMKTNLAAVFEDLLLPVATMHKVKPEDMVKTIFVFSDMHFDNCTRNRKSSSFERIREMYKEAGYEMPQIVFWNLAANSPGVKPVTMREDGTALVSGWNQALLKVFMEGGGFDNVEEEEDLVEVTKEELVEVTKEELVEVTKEELVELTKEELVEVTKEGTEEDGVSTKVKWGMDPYAVLKRSIAHESYAMLTVVD